MNLNDLEDGIWAKSRMMELHSEWKWVSYLRQGVFFYRGRHNILRDEVMKEGVLEG